MNFSWSEEHTNYRNRVIEFAKNELADDTLVQRDHEGTFAKDLWDKCGKFGILGLAAPARYGGTFEEIDIMRAAYALEGLGYGCPDTGLNLALNAHLWTVMMTITLFGDEAQKKKYLPKMASGEWIGAHALTEIGSGSDVYNMKTTAEKVDGGYILNGEKRLVTLAPIADVAVAFASTNPKLGKWGISAFIVDKMMQGFDCQPVQQKMGLRTAPIGRIKFTDCFVPDENRLGKEGAGFSVCNHSLEYDRCCILAGKLGAMQRQLEQTVEYAKSRQQFGQSIGQFQSVSNRIADMKLRLETSRLLLYKMTWLKKNNKPAMLEAAMLKLHLGEAYVASSLDAIRVHGGNGYLTEHEVERGLRDAVGGVIYAGTSDIQRNIIAKFLGL